MVYTYVLWISLRLSTFCLKVFVLLYHSLPITAFNNSENLTGFIKVIMFGQVWYHLIEGNTAMMALGKRTFRQFESQFLCL